MKSIDYIDYPFYSTYGPHLNYSDIKLLPELSVTSSTSSIQHLFVLLPIKTCLSPQKNSLEKLIPENIFYDQKSRFDWLFIMNHIFKKTFFSHLILWNRMSLVERIENFGDHSMFISIIIEFIKIHFLKLTPSDLCISGNFIRMILLKTLPLCLVICVTINQTLNWKFKYLKFSWQLKFTKQLRSSNWLIEKLSLLLTYLFA